MRNSILIFIATIISLQMFAQDTNFEFVLSTHENLRLQSIKEANDGSIFFVGPSNPMGSNKETGLILKLNKYGDLIDTLTLSIPNRSLHLAQVTIDSDNTLIINGFSCDTIVSGLDSRVEIFRLNNNLEILNSNSILISEEGHAGYSFLSFLYNGNIVISGALTELVGSPPTVRYNTKLSPEFDSLHSYIRYSGPGSMAYDTKQNSDSTYLILNNLGAWGGFAETDTMFVETGEYIELPYGVDCDCGIKWDSDSSFFLMGDYFNFNENYKHDIGLFRAINATDTSSYTFNYWGAANDTFDFPAPFNGLSYKNKDTIYAGGTKNFWPWPLDVPSYYSLVQTDSLLNIRWEKFYGGDANYTLLSIDATNDGGCLLGGIKHEFTYEDGKTDAHIIKVNAQGLITGYPNNSKIEIKEALVFPNPGSEYLQVQIATQYQQSTFELFDLNGRLLLSEEIIGKWKQISTTFLPTGTYIFKIHSNDGLFESGKWVKR